MKLKFNATRFKIAIRLLGISLYELSRMMQIKEGKGRKRRFTMDKWGEVEPKIETVKLMSKTIGVPIGYFYFKKVETSIIETLGKTYLHIKVIDTDELADVEIKFNNEIEFDKSEQRKPY